MAKTVHIPVNKFSVASVIREINKHVAGRNVESIFFNPISLLNGTLEIKTGESQATVIIERPSKFKPNATSRFYCVYKKGDKWTYKFVNTKLNPKPFLGKIFDDELDAAIAYDQHRYSVEGDLSKLNFPENYEKVAK